MADDLRRALAGERVKARVFRIGKFAKKYRVAIAAATVAMIIAAILLIIIPQRSRPNELALFYESGLSDGAQKLERFEAAAARDAFRKAVAKTPNDALAWDGVARAENMLGEVGKAADAARRAAANAADLPRDEMERLRAAAHAANHDWAKAIPAFEVLFARQPERIDVGMALVDALLGAGRTDAADTVLGRLRQLPQTANDPRIDLLESEVAHQLSEFQRAAAAAARVRARAQELSAVAMVLRAERIHADAIGRLDRREEARRALEALVKRTTAAGLSRETAATQLALGGILLRIAPAEETVRMLQTALAGLRTAGDQRGQLVARVLLAVQAGRAGELESAIGSAVQCIADARKLKDRWAEGYALSQHMVLVNWADDERAFQATIEPTLAALRDSGNRQVLMLTLGNLAIAAIQRTELDTAEGYLLEAETLMRRVGSQLAHASIDRSRAYLEETRGNFELARERYMAALEKARRAGVKGSIGTYLADLAWLETADEQPDAAEARAKEAIEALTAAGDTYTATQTVGVLAWAAAKRGDMATANRHLDTIRKATEQDGTENAVFSYLVSQARVASALKDWPRAIELRRETVRMAVAWETPGLVIQQQLHLAEALRASGQRRAVEKLVAEVLPEAERHGMHRVTRELRALLAK
jgi:tetratricopeptide (TPR) repeat protein